MSAWPIPMIAVHRQRQASGRWNSWWPTSASHQDHQETATASAWVSASLFACICLRRVQRLCAALPQHVARFSFSSCRSVREQEWCCTRSLPEGRSHRVRTVPRCSRRNYVFDVMVARLCCHCREWSTSPGMTRSSRKERGVYRLQTAVHERGRAWPLLHSQPPVNPARRSPVMMAGQRRMMSQMRPDR